MRNQFRFMDPPVPLRKAHLDNVALVPGNLLPYIKRWHRLAGELPQDEMLVVLPSAETSQRKTLSAVAEALQKSGHHVRILTEQELTPPQFGRMVQEPLSI